MSNLGGWIGGGQGLDRGWIEVVRVSNLRGLCTGCVQGVYRVYTLLCARTAEKLLEEQKVDLAVAKAKLQASYFITQAAGLGGRGQPGCSSDADATPDMRTGALPTPSALAKFFEM